MKGKGKRKKGKNLESTGTLQGSNAEDAQLNVGSKRDTPLESLDLYVDKMDGLDKLVQKMIKGLQ